MSTMAQQGGRRVIVGVDTHRDVHVAVAIDHLGRRVDELSVPTTPRGYTAMWGWAQSLGEVEAFGIEGTSDYGAGLARYLRSEDVVVLEINRPNRKARRLKGKSDPLDAENAARAVLSGQASGAAKAADDVVEMIRILRVVRCSAVKARTQAINGMRALVVTAPADLRQELRGLSATKLAHKAARLRVSAERSTTAVCQRAMRLLARRYLELDKEVDQLDKEIAELTEAAAPDLLEVYGVGTEVAATLLIAAGDNPERLASEAAFSMLCGASPLPASSGKTSRHRLNRGGNRQANAALYRIVMVRLRYDDATHAYVERRSKEGKSKRDIIRCLKRYIAREIFAALPATPPTAADSAA